MVQFRVDDFMFLFVFCFMHIGNSLIVIFFSCGGNIKSFKFSQFNSLKL
jgi:hypothetical protein